MGMCLTKHQAMQAHMCACYVNTNSVPQNHTHVPKTLIHELYYGDCI